MSRRRELINLTITNNSNSDLTIPLFQNGVYTINSTTKYSYDTLGSDLSCGIGDIVINGVTYSFTFDTTVSGLANSLTALGFGFFSYENVTDVYVVDDTNIYGVMNLCVASTTTTTSTTTFAPTTTSTTTTTTIAPTTTTTSTTSTTTTAAPFSCVSCRNWQYLGPTIPLAGDTITYYSCIDGSTQTISLSNGDPSAFFCNCNDLGLPTNLNGTTMTEIGICVPTTTTTTSTTSTTTLAPTTTTTSTSTTSTTTTIDPALVAEIKVYVGLDNLDPTKYTAYAEVMQLYNGNVATLDNLTFDMTVLNTGIFTYSNVGCTSLIGVQQGFTGSLLAGVTTGANNRFTPSVSKTGILSIAIRGVSINSTLFTSSGILTIGGNKYTITYDTTCVNT